MTKVKIVKTNFTKSFNFRLKSSSDIDIHICLVSLNEAQYRWEHSTDPCAVDLLASGIVRFANDAEKIDAMIKEKL